MDANAGAADALCGRQRRKPFEGFNELGTTIGVSRVIERIYPDEDVGCAERLRPGQRQRQEDGVAGGHVGRRDAAGIEGTILRNRRIGGQRGPAKGRQVDVELEVPLDAERLPPRRAPPRARGRDAARSGGSTRTAGTPRPARSPRPYTSPARRSAGRRRLASQMVRPRACQGPRCTCAAGPARAPAVDPPAPTRTADEDP